MALWCLPYRRRRTRRPWDVGVGLALLATMIGLGKAISSITFGWVAQVHGSDAALLTFALLLCGAISAGFALLRAMDQK